MIPDLVDVQASPLDRLAPGTSESLVAERVIDAFRSPQGQLALLTSSPSLFRALESHIQGTDGSRRPEDSSIRSWDSLLKYFMRWAGRATPFGAFVAVSAWPRPEPESLCYAVQTDHRYLERLAAERDSAEFPNRLNPTLHAVGGRCYFFVQDRNSGKLSLKSVPPDTVATLSEMVARSSSGPAPIAADVLNAAVEDGVVVRAPRLHAIGCSAVHQLARTGDGAAMEEVETTRRPTAAELVRLEDVYASPAQVTEAVEHLATTHSHPPGSGDPSQPLINLTTLGSPGEARHVETAIEAVRAHLPGMLGLLWHPPTPEPDEMHRMLLAHAGQEPVPLLEFASQVVWPAMEDGRLPPPHGVDARGKAPVHSASSLNGDESFNRWAFERLGEPLIDEELRLSAIDVSSIDWGERLGDLNQCGYVLASPVRADGEVRTRVVSVGGPTCLSMLGRFTRGSAKVLAMAGHVADAEQALFDGVLVDVCFTPPCRTMNIASRPHMRRRVICVNGPEHTDMGSAPLRLDDLYILDSSGKLGLYSSELGRQVHPRISCNINHRLINDPLSRALWAVQAHEDALSRTWSWRGHSLRTETPRVSLADMVLCPRKWQISLDRDELVQWRRSDTGELTELVGRVRGERNLPRFVTAGFMDRKLVYDLDNPRCRHLLRDLLIKGGRTELEEFLVPADEHATEVVVPISIDHGKPGSLRRGVDGRPIRPIVTPTLDRQGLGRPWVSFEIFAEYEHFGPVIRRCREAFHDLRAAGAARRWFFVRYNDPAPHVRFRVQVSPTIEHHAPEVVAHVHRALMFGDVAGLVKELDTVPYVPEVGRYGGAENMESVHDLFWQDSEYASMAGSENSRASDHSDVILAALFVDRLLRALDTTVSDRHEFARRMSTALAREHLNVDPAYWGREYRQWRSDLRGVLTEGTSDEVDREDLLLVRLAALEEGRIALQSRRLVLRDHGEGAWSIVLSSLIHMHLNRTIRTKARWFEARLYQLLVRAYSEILHWPPNTPNYGT